MCIEIKTISEMNVAYIRHVGPYNQIRNVFERLYKWAIPKGLIGFPETSCLAIYHDDPGYMPTDKLRSDACITVPENTKTEGEVQTKKIESGEYAIGHFEIGLTEFGEAWTSIIRDWSPNGYQRVNRPEFELYLNNPVEHPEEKLMVDIYVPIKPL